MCRVFLQDEDAGDKSDGDLVVDVGNEDDPPRPTMGLNGEHRDSVGSATDRSRSDRPPSNMSSSSRSTPSLKHKDGFSGDKPGTPGSKPTTPNGQPNGKPPTPGVAYPPGFPRPGEMPPIGYPPYQNGGPPPGLVPGFPPRPPMVSVPS